MGFEDGESMDFTEEDEKKMDEELLKVNKPKMETRGRPQRNGDRMPTSYSRPTVPSVPKEVKEVAEAEVMPVEYTKAIKAQPKAQAQPIAQQPAQNDFLVVTEIPQQPVRVVPTEKGQVTLLTHDEALTEILRILRTLEK